MFALVDVNSGLSPLDLIANLCGRFIPAGAGNTEPAYGCIAVFTVYPRWRGEHPFPVLSRRPGGGLSPLARGTRLDGQRNFMTRRFIPAGAGNTSRGGCISPGCAVYPRWRGEHDYTRGVIQDCTGLSPLARGTLAQCQISYVSARFIPAGAGNTLKIYYCLIISF